MFDTGNTGFYAGGDQPRHVNDAGPRLFLRGTRGQEERPGPYDTKFRLHGCDYGHLVHLRLFPVLFGARRGYREP